MKFFAALAAFVLLASHASAQWQTTSYSLKGGWNAIHLSGDAKQKPLEQLLPASVLEVWRWNPNPTQVQFTESPLLPSAGTPEWSVWKRGEPEISSLSQLTGQASYLVKCAGTTAATYSVPILQSPLPPSAQWVRSGANLMGFPTLQNGANFPFFNAYFASFPLATAANTRIFKYTGGDLGAANPTQVFSPATERLDRTKAYWFSADVVGNFYAPIEINLSTNQGIAFGRSGAVVSARIRNRTSAPVTLTFAPTASEAAPSGQTAISGPVPLTRRSFNASTLVWQETPISSAFQVVVAPQATIEVLLGIDRAAMSGAAADAYFASFLRVTDSGNLMDIYLPATASKASLAGLWVGDVSLKMVSNISTTTGNTPREFPLRTLLHVADNGAASLLSEVYIGRLAAGAHDVGVCTDESLLDGSTLASAQRLVSTHLPLDQVLGSGSGGVNAGQALVRTIQIPFDDATNPFVHQYHPDHDNKSPRGAALPAGVESHSITRTCTFNFTASPPAGSTVSSGWGSATIGGTYQEVITGLQRNPITLTGTFELRRANELGTLYTP